MRVCRRCETAKPITDFNVNRSAADKLHAYCRPCQADYARLRRNERERVREAERKYGLPAGAYADLVEKQQGRCAICGEEEQQSAPRGGRRVLSIDHDHETGRVRALLCARCNSGLGHFMDDPVRLFLAIRYLARHGRSSALVVSDTHHY